MTLSTPRFLALAAGVFFALLSSCKKPEAGPAPGGSAAAKGESSGLVIGHYASLTGNTAHFGQDTDKALRLAVDEVNAAGGVLGKPVKVTTLDDRGDSAEAANAVTRLLDVEHVNALVGEVASSLSLAG